MRTRIHTTYQIQSELQIGNNDQEILND